MELLTAVSILGVLAAIAVPTYKQMVLRSRQGEAKGYLTAMYSAEKTFFTENASYTNCLYQIGFQPDGGGVRYYWAGFFNGGGGPQCGPLNNLSCSLYDFSNQTACDVTTHVPWGGPGIWRTDCVFPSNVQNSDWPDLSGFSGASTWYFMAHAIGRQGQSKSDFWSIDSNRNMVNVTLGL